MSCHTILRGLQKSSGCRSQTAATAVRHFSCTTGFKGPFGNLWASSCPGSQVLQIIPAAVPRALSRLLCKSALTQRRRVHTGPSYTNLFPGHPAPAYDMQFPDITPAVLCGGVSVSLGKPYLTTVSAHDILHQPADDVQGLIYGNNLRPFVALQLSVAGVTKWVHFLIISTCPTTYISQTVLDQLFGRNAVSEERCFLGSLHGRAALLRPSHSSFKNINVLGTDFLAAYGAQLIMRYANGSLSIHMDSQIKEPGRAGPADKAIVFFQVEQPGYSVRLKKWAVCEFEGQQAQVEPWWITF